MTSRRLSGNPGRRRVSARRRRPPGRPRLSPPAEPIRYFRPATIYDGFARRLTIDPPQGDAAFVVCVPQAVASARWNESSRTLELTGLSGELQLDSLRLRGTDHDVSVRLAGGETATVEIAAS